MSFYSFTLFSSQVETHGKMRMCTTKEVWFDMAQLISLIDVVITILIPFGIILFTNISIYCKLVRGFSLDNPNKKRRFRFRKNDDYSTSRESYRDTRTEQKSRTELTNLHRNSVQTILIVNNKRRETISFSKDYFFKNLEVKKVNSYPELSSNYELKNEDFDNKKKKSNKQNSGLFKSFRYSLQFCEDL